MQISWTKFKTFIKDKNLDYDEALLEDGDLIIEAYDDKIYRNSVLKNNSTDHTDYINNYQSKAGKNKRGKKWHSQLHNVDFVTSKLNRVYNRNINGNKLNFTSIKYFNSSDVELVAGTQTELDNNCVRTEITWEPDYDIILSEIYIYQPTKPTTDVRVWIQAIPDKTIANGGRLPLLEGGINLKNINDKLVLNLNTDKKLKYDGTDHTNKIKIVTRHNTGAKDPVTVVFKIDRENK